MIEVRVHNAEDPAILPILVDHRHRAGDESAQFRGHLPPHPAGGVRRAYVAAVGKSAVGSLVVRIDDDADWAIDYVHVLREARGVGIGDALMKRLFEDARAAGVTRLSGAALPGDRSTKNLFERFGLIAEAIFVSKDLRS